MPIEVYTPKFQPPPAEPLHATVVRRVDPAIEQVLNPQANQNRCLPAAPYICVTGPVGSETTFISWKSVYDDGTVINKPVDKYHLIFSVDDFLARVLGKKVDHSGAKITAVEDAVTGNLVITIPNLQSDEIAALNELQIFQGHLEEPIEIKDTDTDIQIVALRPGGTYTVSLPENTPNADHLPFIRATHLRDPKDPKRLLFVVDANLSPEKLKLIATHDPYVWEKYQDLVSIFSACGISVGAIAGLYLLMQWLPGKKSPARHPSPSPRRKLGRETSSTPPRQLTEPERDQLYHAALKDPAIIARLSPHQRRELGDYMTERAQQIAASPTTELTSLQPTRQRFAQRQREARARLKQILESIGDPELDAHFNPPPPQQVVQRIVTALSNLFPNNPALQNIEELGTLLSLQPPASEPPPSPQADTPKAP